MTPLGTYVVKQRGTVWGQEFLSFLTICLLTRVFRLFTIGVVIDTFAFSSDAGQGRPLEWRFSSALREFSMERRREHRCTPALETAARLRQSTVSSQGQSLRERASGTEGDRKDEEKRREQGQDRKARVRVLGSAVHVSFLAL